MQLRLKKLCLGIFFVILSGLFFYYDQSQTEKEESPLLLPFLFPPKITPLPSVDEEAAQTLVKKEGKVQAGDTLYNFLERHIPQNAHIVSKILQENKLADKLKENQLFFFSFIKDQKEEQLIKIVFFPHKNKKICLELKDEPSDGFDYKEILLPKKTKFIKGKISQSLYMDATKAGAPAQITQQFVKLISHNVDFQRSIHAGDSFELLIDIYYDEETDQEFLGELIYGCLNFREGTLDIYRFLRPDGVMDYYNAKGQGTRKTLLRTPVTGARISSTFGRRRHPILGYTKMHRGIDFAAPHGTPIMAAGDGIVSRASPYSTYGNYVLLTHNGGYSTAYAHLSRYAKGVRSGKRIKQGEIIGYVGTTGNSTGPHLHYEILKGGCQINPQQFKAPAFNHLMGKDLKSFQHQKSAIATKLVRYRKKA